ncbi:AraC family transcriptional regulator [uncultured Dubosiella sp.]|uniref:AraC family transcriptional regulator n=1 Tax=uncultured Dubosiella sp. TaxID=1937011 RepID=UPI002599A06B|nr:AraC family transcriptional regulator [uncultured Dubosiella sp.]
MRYSCSLKDRSLPLFIDSIGIDWDQEDVNRETGYHYAHWLHTQQGEGVVEVNGNKYTLSQGQGILFLPGVPHRYYKTSQTWKTAYFTFGGALLKDILTLLKIKDYIYMDDATFSFDPFINALFMSMEFDKTYEAEIASGHIYNFLMRLKIFLNNHQQDDPAYHNVVKPLAAYLETHYMDEITNQTIIDQVHYSIQYTTRLFKRLYNMSPYQYLQEVRIRKAKELLVTDSSLSVSEIGERVGFHDTSYFITQFKKSEKLTPKAFRKLYFKS